MVNIKDFKAPPDITGDKLDAIFERQKELMKKYHTIEAASGLLQTYDVPVDLDDAKGQARIKDFAWRCTEELMEAMDAYQQKTHFEEEIADAFHFLVELSILAGLSAKDIIPHLLRPGTLVCYEGENIPDSLDLLFTSHTHWKTMTTKQMVLKFLVSLGMTCHLLKNKPWVQTQRLTDREEFKKRLIKTFQGFIGICLVAKINAESLYNLYFKKSEVNKFRQRSQY